MLEVQQAAMGSEARDRLDTMRAELGIGGGGSALGAGSAGELGVGVPTAPAEGQAASRPRRFRPTAATAAAAAAAPGPGGHGSDGRDGPPDQEPVGGFSAWPPNSLRMADRIRSAKSPSPRDEKRSYRAAVST